MRRLLTLLAMLSLLLCVLAAVMWVRSYRLRFGQVGEPPVLSDYHGEIIYTNLDGRDDYSCGGLGFYAHSGLENIYLEDGGIAVDHVTVLAIPYWAVCAFFSVLPGISLVVHVKRPWRVTENGCAQCGYDLRATPDRCPECGAAPTKGMMNA